MTKDLMLAGILLYAAFAGVAWFLSDRMIFLPPASSYGARSLPVTLAKTEDGVEVAVLHLPNPAARYTLLFSHGNAEDLGHLLPLLEELHAAGFGVLAYDYRGYGLSSDRAPSARGAYLDQAAAYRYATQELKIPASRLIIHGRSLGTGPAVALAVREPIGGLIVESGFVSAFRVMTRVPLLPFDKFQNLRHIKNVRCPVLIIHGIEDAVIPLWHGRRLFAAAQGAKQAWWVEGAGHNDLALVAGMDYLRKLRDFALSVDRLAGH
ncbi:MAG: alpha/beta hydrolase [Nevskiales bacterium]